MSNIFSLDNIDDFSEKINIDDLYEKKQQDDLKKLELFNKILNSVHKRIKMTSRQKKDNQLCWFLVPETILGVPKYDQASCIAYLIDKLKTNGFNVRYIHPNLLLISWVHWIPYYIRNEWKKKTGIVINEYGERVDTTNNDDSYNNTTHNKFDGTDPYLFSNQNDNNIKKQPPKEYTPIKSYKPSGNLVYDDDILNKIEDKFI